MKNIAIIFPLFFLISSATAQKAAPKPVFDDPVYHGAADPVIVYNKSVKKWWMLKSWIEQI